MGRNNYPHITTDDKMEAAKLKNHLILNFKLL